MTATPEETLADEERRRTTAAASAIVAGLLTIAGALIVLTASHDFPAVRLLETLRARFSAPAPNGEGLLAHKVLFYHDHAAQILASQLVPAIAMAVTGFALTFLYRATKARNPELGKLPIVATVAGAVMVLLPATVAAVAVTLDVNAFASAADQSERAARDVLDQSLAAAAYSLVQLGGFTLGLGFLLIALNAMRVGLLTRFMGVLGIIVGALFIVPLEAQLPLVKVFWLLALGALFLGRWPGGLPPAWVTGEAHPWPTQQEIREQKESERAAEGRDAGERRPRRGRAAPPETPAPELPASKPHSSSKKKKRRRR